MADMDFERLLVAVDELPIESVVGRYVELVGHGAERDGLCPFHHDTTLGSFKVNVVKNVWCCFACGEKGRGGVSFYQRLHRLSFRDAVIGTARENGIPVPAKLEGNAEALLPVKQTQKKLPQRHEASLNEKLNPKALDRVYRLFISAAGSMSEEMKADLVSSRHLTEAELSHFFQIPHCSEEFMEDFKTLLSDDGLDADYVLRHTPGFFQNNKTGKLCFPETDGGELGIICHDGYGRINGLEVRHATAEKRKRYTSFSSGFADGRKNASCGSKNGTIVDVLSGKRKDIVVCTEGKFKALALNRIGLTALNMRGVASWPAEQVIRYATNNRISRVLLCYDSDMATNEAVAKAALKFSTTLLCRGLDVEYMVWDIALGKGIDDMINAGNAKSIERRDAKWYNDFVLRPLILNKQGDNE